MNIRTAYDFCRPLKDRLQRGFELTYHTLQHERPVASIKRRQMFSANKLTNLFSLSHMLVCWSCNSNSIYILYAPITIINCWSYQARPNVFCRLPCGCTCNVIRLDFQSAAGILATMREKKIIIPYLPCATVCSWSTCINVSRGLYPIPGMRLPNTYPHMYATGGLRGAVGRMQIELHNSAGHLNTGIIRMIIWTA